MADPVVRELQIMLPSVPHTTEGLRDALFDEINALRMGTSTIQKAKAISMMAARIIDSIRVQVQYQKLLVDAGNKNVQLGSLATAGEKVVKGEAV